MRPVGRARIPGRTAWMMRHVREDVDLELVADCVQGQFLDRTELAVIARC